MRSTLEMLEAAGLSAALILGMGGDCDHLAARLENRIVARTEVKATPVTQKDDGTKTSRATKTAAACDASADNPGAPVKGVHSVTLSWNASAPVTRSPQDAVIGYFVYRSMKRHDPMARAINSRPVPDTTCIDRQIESGKTYYYAVRGVNAIGVVGRPSKEIKVRVPH